MSLAVADNLPGFRFDGLEAGTLSFSPDSKRFAYVAFIGEKQYVVVDGRSSPDYAAILRGTPIFSPDGKRVAYAAARQNRWSVYVDGQAGRP